jgi:uncharacterized membrane protein YfcA
MFLPSLERLFLPTLRIDEELLGVTIPQIQNFSPKLMDIIQNLIQLVGLYLVTTAIAVCILSLVPYRRGERWAWYAVLILGSTVLIGGLVLFIITFSIPPSFLDILLVLLLIVGLVLPVKEFFSQRKLSKL